MQKINLTVILTVLAGVLIALGTGYVAGVATAGTGQLGHQSILSQLRDAQEGNLVDRAMSIISNKYFMPIDEATKQDMYYSAVTGMLATLRKEPFKDEFSNFYDPKLYDDLNAQTTGEYAGVGILMGLTSDGMYPEVENIFPKTPAEEAGLQMYDVITEIDGKDTFGMILPEVATKIKGAPGSKVKLRIYRPTETDLFDFEIVRKDVQYSSITKKDLLEGGVGFIQINNFADQTGADFRAAMDELGAKGMKSLIIDLRNNPGGVLDAAIEVADCFVKEGPIVSVAYREGKPDVFNARKDSKKYSLPIVVLINSMSASASEVLTGALKDLGLAKIIGEKSFGKGVVQEVVPMETTTVERREADGSIKQEKRPKDALAVTIAKYYTPLHHDIHGIGIDPDIWFTVANDMRDDPKLKALQEQMDVKREELRKLRGQLTTYYREKDSVKQLGVSVAQKLMKGESVPDVPELKAPETGHSPLGSAAPDSGNPPQTPAPPKAEQPINSGAKESK